MHEEMEDMSISGLLKATSDDEKIKLRDWFAGQVIPHIYAKYVEFANDHGYDEEWKSNLADEAFNIADAMMEARKK